MSAYEHAFWSSRDGLRLHYRDYGGPADKPPLLCLPGLTRNCRDFENLAERHAGQWRMLCPDMRGRGDSAYARDSATYIPLQYVEDVELLLDAAGVDRFVAVGTSLGGLISAILALKHPQRLAGALLNDIGPVIEPAGLQRVCEYVGQGRSFTTWMHAARALEEVHGEVYPQFDLPDWVAMAKRTMAVGQNGRIVFDYDMKIAEPFSRHREGPPLDLWPAFAALAGRPVLVLRGALSDLLSAATLDDMLARLPGAEGVTIPNVGHAPTLDEPEARAAIDRFLASLATDNASQSLG